MSPVLQLIPTFCCELCSQIRLLCSPCLVLSLPFCAISVSMSKLGVRLDAEISKAFCDLQPCLWEAWWWFWGCCGLGD